ncbi:MAG: glycosyltransferase family 4 protein [Elusimicrobiota bacterium]
MIRTVHVIAGLAVGGAEVMLFRLLSRLDRDAFEPEVVSMTGDGPLAEKIRALGVPVSGLGMRRGVPDPRGLARLAVRLRARRPGVVQTWMYHADLLGGLAAKLAGGPPVVWGVHHSNLDPAFNKRSTLFTARACARLSRALPARIVCCSEASRRVHAALGYDAAKMAVIPNGFDLAEFKPDPEARASVRRELDLPEDALLVGLVGRFDPLKDHRSFAAAAARMKTARVHFLLCGDGVEWGNPDLVRAVDAAGPRSRFHLLGRRGDVPRLTAALDVAASSSLGEGFPNAVGEAMACGVPCAVTDVGDSGAMVGETGKVVPAGDPEGLARALDELLALPIEGRRRLGEAARARVAEFYSLSRAATRYESLYKEIARASP